MLTDRRKTNDLGFTLMEVLVVLATMSMLAATSVPTYKKFIELAYKTHQIKAITDMVTALEIGITHIEEESPNSIYEEFVRDTGYVGMYTGRLHPGPVNGNSGGWQPYAAEMVPGYVSGRNMLTGISWDPTCAEGDSSCWRIYGFALHCKTTKRYGYYQRGDRTIVKIYVQNPETCLGAPIP